MKKLIFVLYILLCTTSAIAQINTTIPIPGHTILGNGTSSPALPGALTTLPAAAMPAYNGDCTAVIGTTLLTCNGSTAPSFVANQIQSIGGFTNTPVSSNPQGAPTTDIGNVPYAALQSGLPIFVAGGCSIGSTGLLSGCASGSSLSGLPATFAQSYLYFPATIIAPVTTITSVAITGTAGQFSCTCTGLAVGQNMTLTGTYGGTGSITGYGSPTTYYVSATNGTSTFTLQTTAQVAIVTTAGTPTGLTYATPGSAAGFYLVNMTSITAGQICSPIVLYSAGTPAPSSACNSFIPNTTGAFSPPGTILAAISYTLPANVLGVNGCVEFNAAQWNDTVNSTKTMTFNFGAASNASLTPTTIAFGRSSWRVCNAGVKNHQVANAAGSFNANTAAAMATANSTYTATNTGNSNTLTISMTNATTANTAYQVLMNYSIVVTPN